VHAFEPNPFVYAFLKTNVEGLANVRANPYALSDRCGTATLYFPKSFLTAWSSLKPIYRYLGLESRHIVRVGVPMITLDRYVAMGRRPPTFIKIDVEGAEDLVVSGGLETLKTYRPRVSMEVWGDPLPGDSHLRAAEKLHRLGYVPHRILDDGSLERISLEGIKRVKFFDNFVFDAA